MLFPIAIAIVSMQAGVFARSLESTSLSQILSEGIKENRPIIIVLLQSSPDRHDHFDFRDDTLRNPVARATDSCKENLRQKLKSKCNDMAICKDVIWSAAEILCDDNNIDNVDSAGKLASYIF